MRLILKQSANAYSLIAVTDAGMEIDLREEHSAKAAALITDTEVGIAMDVMEVQE